MEAFDPEFAVTDAEGGNPVFENAEVIDKQFLSYFELQNLRNE